MLVEVVTFTTLLAFEALTEARQRPELDAAAGWREIVRARELIAPSS